MSNIKNIIIFIVIAGILILVYIYFIKKSPDQNSLVVSSSSELTATSNTNISDPNAVIAGDFLKLLLSVKNIKLNDSILSDVAFASLHDSSITLTPDGNEGRANPFAPLGNDFIIFSNTNSTAQPAVGAPAR